PAGEENTAAADAAALDGESGERQAEEPIEREPSSPSTVPTSVVGGDDPTAAAAATATTGKPTEEEKEYPEPEAGADATAAAAAAPSDDDTAVEAAEAVDIEDHGSCPVAALDKETTAAAAAAAAAAGTDAQEE
ncbi:unnamed protein product, partial [Ectocarpus sp. 8 AP-2014]